MRELLFRAWDKEGNNYSNWQPQMIYTDNWAEATETNGSILNPCIESKRFIFEQYTGRKDNNNVKAFAHDLFTYNEKTYRIEYVEDYLTWAIFTEKEWGRYNKGNNHFKYCYSDEERSYFLHELESYEFEIIGNIHEGEKI